MRIRKIYTCSFVWLVLGLLPTVAHAQQQVPLKDMLTDVEKTYDVRFSYKAALVRPLSVKKVPLTRGKSLSAVLDEVLRPPGLAYRHTQGKYYVITPGVRRDPPSTGKSGAGTNTASQITVAVLDQESHLPLAHASIEVLELGLRSQSDLEGMTVFRGLPSGSFTLTVQYIGYIAASHSVASSRGTTTVADTVYLMPANLRVDAVQVTAREANSKDLSTASTIGRMAIEHIQPTSLADVLQLLPGKLAEKPALTDVNKVSLRQVNTDNTGSLGTALLINGMPISNNANMQFNHSATGGVTASYATTAGAGIDFRQITADNIESVEVIRGIPSVVYGDLTSGAIMVNTKAGKQPLVLKSRINPTLTQFWAGQGFELPRQLGLLNVDVDYTKAVSDQRFSVLTFNRYTSNVLHQKSFGEERPFRLRTGLSYSANIGQKKPDPDDPQETSNKASDYAFRFYNTGQWETQRKFARSVDYSLSIDYTHQKSYQQAAQSGGFPIVYSMEEGLSEATLVNGTYLSQLWVDGKPFYLYAKIGNTFYGDTGPVRHRVQMGAEWRTSDNFGKGKSYDRTRPPRLETGAGTRPRSYRELPGLHQLSLYAEDLATVKFGRRALDVQMGLRYDNVQPDGLFGSRFDQVLSPRINISFDLLSDLELRAGYGLAAKSPTLAYLNPQNAYYDAISLNHTSENVAERLVLVSTYIKPTENVDLKMAVNRKKEIGLRWRVGQRYLNVTAYHEHITNGYDYQNTLETFHVLEVPLYTVVDRPVGERPVISGSPTGYRTYFVDYDMPTNGRDLINKGIEFDMDFGRIDAVRTSFLLNGAWMSTENTQNTYYMLKKSQTSEAQRERVGIYPTGRGKEDVRFNTTWRIVHHIPRFRLIASLVAQTTWIDKNSYVGYEKRAIGYLPINGSQVVWLTQEQRNNLDPDTDEDIILDIDDTYFRTESWKPLWLFNFRLTKEIGNNLQFSFYANNVFSNRPLESSTRKVNEFTRRNQPLFFGLELNLKLFNK